MGLYGSPDLTPRNNNGWEKPKKKRDWSGIIWAVIITACLVFIIGTKEGNLYFKDLFQKNSNSSPLQSNTSTSGGIGDTNPIGSRKNPAHTGDIQHGVATDDRGLDCTLEIELTDFKRGDEAVKIMQEGHSAADNPGEGKEFALVKFRVKNIRDNSGKDIPFTLTSADFSYATGNYVVTDARWAVYGLNPAIEADLYEGAEHEGWICFSIEKDDAAPKAIFLNEIWFDLVE